MSCKADSVLRQLFSWLPEIPDDSFPDSMAADRVGGSNESLCRPHSLPEMLSVGLVSGKEREDVENIFMSRRDEFRSDASVLDIVIQMLQV